MQLMIRQISGTVEAAMFMQRVAAYEVMLVSVALLLVFERQLALASRTPHRGALADCGVLQFATAVFAGLAFAAVHHQFLL